MNLKRHAANVKKFGLKPIIAINRFPTDTDYELAELLGMCENAGIKAAVTEAWAKGGEGSLELAEMVIKAAAEQAFPHRMLYTDDMSIADKIRTVAKEIYHAAEVVFQPGALADIRLIEKLGLGHLPVCIAKTQYSFSDQPKLTGAPEGFTLTIRQVEIASGAGFVIPIAGDIMRMPGLPNNPAAEQIDIDAHGVISGLF